MQLRRFTTILTLALALGLGMTLTLAGGVRAADPLTVQLTAQNNSGQSGTATLTDMGDGTTKVVLSLTDLGATPQPVHIHDGTCATLNPTPKYPLTNMVNGKSETVVKVAMGQLLAQPFAINAHKSGQEVSVYTACGNIVAQAAGYGGALPTAPRTGGGGMAARDAGLPLAAGAALLALALGGAAYARRRRQA